MSRILPTRPSLSQLKKQAKSLHRAVQERDPQALVRVIGHHPACAGATGDDVSAQSWTLRDAQLTLAREYGSDNWQALCDHVEDQSNKRSLAEVRDENVRRQTSSPEEIAAIVKNACGSTVRHSERILRDFSCEVHRVTTEDGQQVVYKANWHNKGPRAYCAGNWPPISLEVGHPFRRKLAGCFARSWPLFGDLPKWPAT